MDVLLQCFVTQVYDATGFADAHPPGPSLITDYAGQDATGTCGYYFVSTSAYYMPPGEFESVGHSDKAEALLAGLLIGELVEEDEDEDTVDEGEKLLADVELGDLSQLRHSAVVIHRRHAHAHESSSPEALSPRGRDGMNSGVLLLVIMWVSSMVTALILWYVPSLRLTMP